jgi:hypothetical protein
MRSHSFLASFLMSFTFATVVSAHALAAGYNCLSVDRDTQAIVYLDQDGDHEPAAQAKQLVFIDPELSKQTQTLAVFSKSDGVLLTDVIPSGHRFTGKVDLSASAIGQPGKRLGGTKLGLLESVTLEIETITARHQIEIFSEGAMFAAQVHYLKKSGQVLTQDFDCASFLGEGAPAFLNESSGN